MKAGVIGLGQMGSGLAVSLLKAGHEVTVYNRTRARVEPLFAQAPGRLMRSPMPAEAKQSSPCCQMMRPCNASHSVEARLSRLLLRARDLSDREGLPLTQEFLAQMIGVRRNAVSIVAHAFQQAGLVSYSRGHIEIRDIDGLRRTACECYAAVRTQCDRLLNPAS